MFALIFTLSAQVEFEIKDNGTVESGYSEIRGTG
jgi:hypothetical protein